MCQNVQYSTNNTNWMIKKYSVDAISVLDYGRQLSHIHAQCSAYKMRNTRALFPFIVFSTIYIGWNLLPLSYNQIQSFIMCFGKVLWAILSYCIQMNFIYPK